MDVDEAVRTLRAVRTYSEREITCHQIEAWIDVARWCGSGRNSQPWRFIAVRAPDRLVALSTLGDSAEHLARCKVAIALAAGPAPYEYSRTLDMGRVVQCLALVAHNAGVGSCVAVFGPIANVRAAGRLLRVPQDYTIDLAVGFGYPSECRPDSDALASPRGRLATNDLLRWEEFDAPSVQGR